MPRISEERREADQLREKIKSMLADPLGWSPRFEDQRYFLRKLLRDDADYIFSKGQRDAVGRINYMRAPFEGWAGYSVQELVRDARASFGIFMDSDQDFLDEIEHARRLTRGDIGVLVGLCRTAGLDIPRFDQRVEEPEAA